MSDVILRQDIDLKTFRDVATVANIPECALFFQWPTSSICSNTTTQLLDWNKVWTSSPTWSHGANKHLVQDPSQSCKTWGWSWWIPLSYGYETFEHCWFSLVCELSDLWNGHIFLEVLHDVDNSLQQIGNLSILPSPCQGSSEITLHNPL